jgi:UDP-2-acetamido-3-amino-2,3-dideoxy-glucuronate N-acetyltransferase
LGDKINLTLIGWGGHWGKNLALVFYKLGVLRTICDSSKEILLNNVSKYPEITTTFSSSDFLASPDINAVMIVTPE